MIHLSLAQENDLFIITELARRIWNEYYVDIIGQKQVDYMLNKMYNHQSLLEQQHQKKHVFYLIKQEEEPIGFISVSSENASDFFIHKFYLDQHYSNTGIGSKTLQLLTQIINPKSLMLTVNRQNYKSINFYFKNGFKIKQVADFDIGNGYTMNDFVMEKKIIRIE